MQTGQAERLFPLLEEILGMSGKAWKDISLLAVTTGPGNFTGVRIAVSAARGLSLSLGIRAVGVTVLQALAHPHRKPVLVLLDARRGRLYAQLFADGESEAGAELTTFEALAAREWPAGMICTGFRCRELAARTGTGAGREETLADPADIAVCAAASRELPREGRPAPLYLRSADAALPADPPMTILDDA